MFKNIWWVAKRQILAVLITLSIVFCISAIIPLYPLLLTGAGLSHYTLIGSTYGSLLFSLFIMFLVLGCITMSYVRFLMQLGFSRDKALLSTIIGNTLVIFCCVMMFEIMRLIRPDSVFLSFKTTLYGLLLVYYLGFFANSVVSCMRPRFSIPVLIMYFALLLNGPLIVIDYVYNYIWLCAILYLLFNIVAGYALFKSKFSIIKPSAI